MGSENWYKIDNVAKVFLASVTKRDPRTLRVSATLKDNIDPEALQEAVLSAIQDRPQVQVRIRRGLFWHYMEDTDILPAVAQEKEMCAMLYTPATAMLHYQVTYFGRRINLELFHALSDGTGALEFLNIIVLNYLKLKHPGELDDVTIHSGASANDLSQDSFRQFFGGMTGMGPTLKRAFRPGTLKLPFDQLQFFEIHMPVAQIIPMTKKLGVSMTSFFGAEWMMAVRAELPPRSSHMPITVTLPVNLRNYYPSNTVRNFFTNVNVTHTFDSAITVDELAVEFDRSLKSQLTQENVKKVMDGFETIEYVAPVRPVPLFIKQLAIRHATKVADKNVSVILSNLGVQKPPAEMAKYIENYSAYCSSQNLFSTMSSYNGELTLGVTLPFTNTGAVKNLVRSLSAQGVDIKVYATEVII
ncbi:MAG: hypothetical protein K6F92_06075 [Lachnospiraceae bacterium]|nr:hypothetical protein [Lachnospiraceae bacterium]